MTKDTTMKGLAMDFCINEQGEAIIPIDPDGLPSSVGIIPTWTYPLEQRLAVVEQQLDVLALQGRWADGWKWIKNQVFDDKGEKTTAEIRFRVCKNKDEATIVANRIKEIVDGLDKAD